MPSSASRAPTPVPRSSADAAPEQGRQLVKKSRILVVLLSLVLTVGMVGGAQARSSHPSRGSRTHAGSTAALAPSVRSGPASATATFPVGTTTITVAAPTRNITVF